MVSFHRLRMQRLSPRSKFMQSMELNTGRQGANWRREEPSGSELSPFPLLSSSRFPFLRCSIGEKEHRRIPSVIVEPRMLVKPARLPINLDLQDGQPRAVGEQIQGQPV